MSSAKLGPLPDFGQQQALTGSSRGGGLGKSSLDDALDSLLEGDGQPGITRRRRAKQSATPGDANFYSSLATDDSDDSADDGDVAGTEASAQHLASSVEDMEASLFSSFTRKSSQAKADTQRKKKSAARPLTQPDPAPPPPTSSSSSRGLSGSKEGGGKPSAEDTQQKPKEKEDRSKASKTDFDDDLLDLFSDDVDIVPKKRGKPSFDLTGSKPRAGSSKPDSNPTTSLSQQQPLSPHTHANEIERPKSRHAPKQESQTEQLPSPTHHTVDVLCVSSPARHPKPANSTVDFGDDDGDILTDLGLLEDTSTVALKSKPTTQKADGSRLTELLGRKEPMAGSGIVASEPKVVKVSPSVKEEREEDGFNFGAYQPSIASERRHQRRGIPSEGRRGTLDDSLTARPSTAPAPEKKSVRFAENLEAERPSSSPATNGTPKPSLRMSSRLDAPQTETKPTAAASKRPPLPRKDVKSISQNSPLDASKRVADVTADSQSASMVTAAGDSDLLSVSESTGKQRLTSRHQLGKPPSHSSAAASLFEERDSEDQTGLQHPVYPWQRSSEQATASEGKPTQPPASNRRDVDHVTSHDQSPSQLASFQQEQIQQQQQVAMHEQQLSLQQTKHDKPHSAHVPDTQQLSAQLKSAQDKIRELESDLSKGASECAELRSRLAEVGGELGVCEGRRRGGEEECRALRERCRQLEGEQHGRQTELSSQLEELRIKLHQCEVEKGELQQSLVTAAARHSEELAALDKANQDRLAALEESFQRREARWREGAESASSRAQERLQQVERESSDTILALRGKLSALEASKSSEIARQEDTHHSAVEQLKRGHEADLQQLASRHREELEAVRTALSHGRLLSELSEQVEASARGVGLLQARLEEGHSRAVREGEQGNKTLQEHLKVLEERLVKQQADNDVERERLHALIARLEGHASQQGRQLQQDRWLLQQDTGRLRAQQSAFEEERATALRRLADEGEQLQQAKEKFLEEQRGVLGQCYEERRALARERAEVTLLQRRALEREQRDTQKNLQADAELEAVEASARVERARVASETARLREDQDRLKCEQQALVAGRARVEELQAAVSKRAAEMEQQSKSAGATLEQGQRCMAEAQALREELAGRSKVIQRQAAELREKEQRVAADQLRLAQKMREFQLLQSQSKNSQAMTHVAAYSLSEDNGSTENLLEGSPSSSPEPAAFTSSRALSSSLPATTTTTALQQQPSVSVRSQGQQQQQLSYSLQASPGHRPAALTSSSSLAQIQQQRSSRQRALEIEKDYADLEEERRFLASLQNIYR